MTASPDLSTLDEHAGDLRAGRMGTRVFDILRQAIVQLRLKPGNLLSEADIARQLGVSRQPVREAFIKLSEIGLVEVRPQRGTYVMLISIRQVQNVRFIREAVESAVVRKAASEATPEMIAPLRDLLVRQRQAGEKSDHAEFLRLDELFHQAIAQSADCDYAWRTLENLKAQMDRVRYLSVPDATPFDILIGQHTAIVDSIERHAPDDAEAAMKVHLAEILKSLPRLAQSHRDLFTS